MNKQQTITRQLFAMPPEIAYLPRDARGYPIPAFAYIGKDGQPDFRVVKPSWRETCHLQKKCWLCGGRMGARKWFVIGPMCGITRTTSEPPCHRLCAEFAVKNCPFLTKPLAKRNLRDMPDEGRPADGNPIDRNPGVALVWETASYKPFVVGDGWLIELGDPDAVTAWREGRKATRAEIIESVDSGYPLLHEEADREGREAREALALTYRTWRHDILDRFFPATVP